MTPRCPSSRTPDALDLTERMASGVLTPAQVIEDAIQLIEAADPAINAVIHRRFESARDEAQRVPSGTRFGGLPLLIKDALCPTAGDPYHFGMRLLREANWHASHDSFLAQRFRQAGFIVLGRTNTPELAGSYATEPVAYGPTRNPWDLSRSTGGSSGGSAAAVAAGFVPVSHGNDTGGSIRVPASMCGVIGVKPSRGSITLGPDFGEFRGFLTCEGVFTRSVKDAAAVLASISGPATGDPYVTIAGWKRPRAGKGLRVGVVTAAPGGRQPVDPQCEAAALSVAAALADAGHHVQAVQMPAFRDASYEPHMGSLVAVGMRRDLDRWSEVLGHPIGAADVEPWTWEFARKGAAVSASSYVASVESLQSTCREISTWWRTKIDILITPTVPVPPPALGFVERAEHDVGVFARPFNVTGQPALSFPAAISNEGLPIGVQLVGSVGKDRQLLEVAAQVEAALGVAAAPRLPVQLLDR